MSHPGCSGHPGSDKACDLYAGHPWPIPPEGFEQYVGSPGYWAFVTYDAQGNEVSRVEDKLEGYESIGARRLDQLMQIEEAAREVLNQTSSWDAWDENGKAAWRKLCDVLGPEPEEEDYSCDPDCPDCEEEKELR